MPTLTSPTKNENLPLGVTVMSLAFLMFVTTDGMAKWLTVAGMAAIQVAFVRFVGHFLTTLLVYLPKLGRSVFSSVAPGVQLTRALALLFATVLNYAAVQYLPLTVTVSIFFATPLLTCLIAAWLLGESLDTRRLLAVVSGFFGVLVIVRPSGAAFHWAMACSVGATLAAAVYFVLTRRVARLDSNGVAQVYASGVPTLVLLPVAALAWTSPTSALDFGLMIVIGALGALGHSLATVALRYAQASSLAPVAYVEIFYATVIGWVVFSDVPEGGTVLGSLVIISSGLYLWRRERALQRAAP